MDKNICGTTASWIVYTNKSFSAWIQWKYWDDWMNRVPNGATWQEINLEHPYWGCLRGDGTIPFPFEVSSINPIEVETGQSEQSVEATFKEKQETTLSIVTGEGAHPIYKHYRCKKGAIQHITRYRWRCRCSELSVSGVNTNIFISTKHWPDLLLNFSTLKPTVGTMFEFWNKSSNNSDISCFASQDCSNPPDIPLV